MSSAVGMTMSVLSSAIQINCMYVCMYICIIKIYIDNMPMHNNLITL